LIGNRRAAMGREFGLTFVAMPHFIGQTLECPPAEE
jgi:hypothetical protein